MNWNWNGNTSGIVTSTAQNLPNKLEYFTLVPKADAVVNVYKISGAAQICIIPNNTSILLGEMWEDTGGTVILATEQIKIQTNASLDYDFTIKVIEP